MALHNTTSANSTRLSVAIADIPLTPLGMKATKDTTNWPSCNKENAKLSSKLSRRRGPIKSPRHPNCDADVNVAQPDKVEDYSEQPFSSFINRRRKVKKKPLQVANVNRDEDIVVFDPMVNDMTGGQADLSIVDIRPSLPLPKFLLSPRNIRRDSFYTDIDDGSFVEFLDDKTIDKQTIPRLFYTCNSSENDTRYSTSSKTQVADVNFRKFIDAVNKPSHLLIIEEEVTNSKSGMEEIHQPNQATKRDLPQDESMVIGSRNIQPSRPFPSVDNLIMNSTLNSKGINASKHYLPNISCLTLNDKSPSYLHRSPTSVDKKDYRKNSEIKCISISSDESDSIVTNRKETANAKNGVESSFISEDISVISLAINAKKIPPVPMEVAKDKLPVITCSENIASPPATGNRVSEWILTSPFKDAENETIAIYDSDEEGPTNAANSLPPSNKPLSSQKLALHLSFDSSSSRSSLNRSGLGTTVFTVEKVHSPIANTNKNSVPTVEKQQPAKENLLISSEDDAIYSSEESSGSTLRSAKKYNRRYNFLQNSNSFKKLNPQTTIVIDSDCEENYQSASPASSLSASDKQRQHGSSNHFQNYSKIPINQRKFSFEESMKKLMLSSDSCEKTLNSSGSCSSNDHSRNFSADKYSKSNSITKDVSSQRASKTHLRNGISDQHSELQTNTDKHFNGMTEKKNVLTSSSEDELCFESYINKWKRDTDVKQNSRVEAKTNNGLGNSFIDDETEDLSFCMPALLPRSYERMPDSKNRKNKERSLSPIKRSSESSVNSDVESEEPKIILKNSRKKSTKPFSVFSSDEEYGDEPIRTKKPIKKSNKTHHKPLITPIKRSSESSVNSDVESEEPNIILKDSRKKSTKPFSVFSSDIEDDEPIRTKKPIKKSNKTQPKPLITPANNKSKSTNLMTPLSAIPKKLSFLQSLSVETPVHRSHVDAIPFLKNFKQQKEALAYKLYHYFNKNVFDGLLPCDFEILWNVHLTKTAGYCRNRIDRKKSNGKSAMIELSVKVLDNTARLRDTLIHEMCHAATWLISGVVNGHGQIWRGWAAKAMNTFPELPPITRCHSYNIECKYVYICTKCGAKIGRHSKSLDINKKVCGRCRGKFELQVNYTRKAAKKDTPQNALKTPRAPNAFALFVKNNYSAIKSTKGNVKHGEVMKALSEAFGKLKTSDDRKTP